MISTCVKKAQSRETGESMSVGSLIFLYLCGFSMVNTKRKQILGAFR